MAVCHSAPGGPGRQASDLLNQARRFYSGFAGPWKNYSARRLVCHHFVFTARFGSRGIIGRIRLNAAAVTVADPKTVVPTGSGAAVAASANIVIQSNPLGDFYYATRSLKDLALTLIHELGHVFNIVAGERGTLQHAAGVISALFGLGEIEFLVTSDWRNRIDAASGDEMAHNLRADRRTNGIDNKDSP